MTIVTITSDWIKGDYALASLKGRLLSEFEDIIICDITHSIPAHDVIQETFVLKGSYPSFPKGTIHLMCVASEPPKGSQMAVVYSNGHYFIGVNDGRFSHLFDNLPSIAFEVKKRGESSAFTALDALTTGVRAVKNNDFETLTTPCEVRRESVRSTSFDKDSITGRVMYIDSFGNVVTNIERSLFERLCNGREYTIYVQGPYTKLSSISEDYSGHRAGEIFAIFNNAGLLEIGIFYGDISKLESVETSAEVRIKFKT